MLVGLSFLLASSLLAAPAYAQAGSARATGAVLDGTVSEAATGAPLPGAAVRLPGLERGAATDADGRFRITGLPADTVTVVVTFVGFAPTRRVADLRSGRLTLRFGLDAAGGVLGEIEVVADEADVALTRDVRAVAVLDDRDLVDARGQSLGETIGQLPGVTTLSTGPSIRKPVIRGLHSERVVVLNNGVRQEGQQWGAEHAPEIDPFAADRIEVVRGAAGVEFGAGAIGGVVRIEASPLPTRPGALSGDVEVQGFSNSGQGAGSVTVEGAPLAGLGLRVQASARRAGDARTPDYVLGNTAFFERSLALTAGLTRERWDVEARASRFATDLGVYRGSHFNTFDALDTVFALGRPPVDYTFEYEIGAPKQAITHDLASVRGRLRLGGLRLEGQYGVQYNRREEFDADRIGGRDPLGRPAFSLDLYTHALDAKATTNPRALAGGQGFAVVGVNGTYQGNDSRVGYLIPNFRSYSGGAFVRGEWGRGPLTLEAGARLDARYQRSFPRAAGGRGDFEQDVRTFGSPSGALGAIWRFAPSWSLATGVSTAWRPPSTNELYSYGIHHGAAQFETGDRTLGAERSVGADLTLRHESARASLELSAFANQIGGYLYLQPSGELVTTSRGVYPGFQYTQTDAVLVGIDGAAAGRLGPLSLGATLSVVRGTDRTLDQPLLAMPADRLGLRAAYRLPDVGPLSGPTFELGATLVRHQDQFPVRPDATGTLVPVDYVAPPDGYALLRAGLSTEVPLGSAPARLSLTVENALDTAYRDYLSRYRYFAHDPGRNVVLRLQVPLGTP